MLICDVVCGHVAVAVRQSFDEHLPLAPPHGKPKPRETIPSIVIGDQDGAVALLVTFEPELLMGEEGWDARLVPS